MKKPDYNGAMAAWIERNDVVVQVARMINPGAFSVWFRSSASDAKPVPPDVHKRYAQSAALTTAAAILKFAATTPKLKQLLADSEAQGWQDLGVPVATEPKLRKIIDHKHGLKPPSHPHP